MRPPVHIVLEDEERSGEAYPDYSEPEPEADQFLTHSPRVRRMGKLAIQMIIETVGWRSAKCPIYSYCSSTHCFLKVKSQV